MSESLPTQINSFESVRRSDENGNEFWFARELAPLLDYQDYRNFLRVVEKAKQACEGSGYELVDHFGDLTKMVDIGSGAQRAIEDIKLSRYACYLLVQNADPSKATAMSEAKLSDTEFGQPVTFRHALPQQGWGQFAPTLAGAAR